jgi:hypothetical protein
LIAFRLSQHQQEQAERGTKRKASKKQQHVQSTTLYLSGWVLVVTTLPHEHWSDREIFCLYQARWHIELLFKRIKQFLQQQSLRCKTAATAKATITLLLLGWAGYGRGECRRAAGHQGCPPLYLAKYTGQARCSDVLLARGSGWSIE